MQGVRALFPAVERFNNRALLEVSHLNLMSMPEKGGATSSVYLENHRTPYIPIRMRFFFLCLHLSLHSTPITSIPINPALLQFPNNPTSPSGAIQTPPQAITNGVPAKQAHFSGGNPIHPRPLGGTQANSGTDGEIPASSRSGNPNTVSAEAPVSNDCPAAATFPGQVPSGNSESTGGNDGAGGNPAGSPSAEGGATQQVGTGAQGGGAMGQGAGVGDAGGVGSGGGGGTSSGRGQGSLTRGGGGLIGMKDTARGEGGLIGMGSKTIGPIKGLNPGIGLGGHSGSNSAGKEGGGGASGGLSRAAGGEGGGDSARGGGGGDSMGGGRGKSAASGGGGEKS